MDRLKKSAAYFDYQFDLADIELALHSYQEILPTEPCRIRLKLHRDGTHILEFTPVDQVVDVPGNSVALAKEPIDKDDIFLYHKTTQRTIYETNMAAFPKCDDVILYNDANEITESCLANVVVQMNGKQYTPPIHCGLLGGTFRAWLLEQKLIEERVINVADLKSCEKIFLINSVRKWIKAKVQF